MAVWCAGVRYVWLVDPSAQVLEVYTLREGGYLRPNASLDEFARRYEPFDAADLEAERWWDGP